LVVIKKNHINNARTHEHQISFCIVNKIIQTKILP